MVTQSTAVESSCRLEQLLPEKTYSDNIAVVSDDERKTSAPSDEVSLTTFAKEVGFAETIVKRCKRISNRNGMDIYGVPLTQTTELRSTVVRFAFGKADGRKGEQNGRMQHRTILVMGATGSGKTTLINGMINYILNVQWEDTFHFQLIQEQTAAADLKLTVRPVASTPTTSIMRKDFAFRIPSQSLTRPATATSKA